MSVNSSAKPINPIVLWAQREDKIFFTIEVWDVRDKSLSFTENSVSFSGRKGDSQQPYSLELEFYSNIKPTPISESVSGRTIFLVLEKEEPSMWPRLTKDANKFPYVKTDFERWVDPDEEEPEAGQGFDFSNFPGLKGGGMGDMGGMDMDDDELDYQDHDEEEEPLDEEVKKQFDSHEAPRIPELINTDNVN